MIKANELRIGNWVYNSGEPYKIDWRNDDYWHTDSLEPIPLTPEILEKCGFNNFGKDLIHSDFAIEKRKDIAVLWPNEGCTETHNIKVPCKYLHQLQNLFFALTGEELEINIDGLQPKARKKPDDLEWDVYE
jgi:hypothetical protein